jgi:hypothetical protein
MEGRNAKQSPFLGIFKGGLFFIFGISAFAGMAETASAGMTGNEKYNRVQSTESIAPKLNYK